MTLLLRPCDRIREGKVGTRDSRRARAAVGLEDITVQDDGVLAKGLHVDDRPEAASDET